MMTLTPAYGRDYKSKADALAAFRGGKDFIINDVTSPWDGKPCSISDLSEGERVKIRYKGLRNVFVVEV